MWFSVADFHSLLVSPWSLPIRSACLHLSQRFHEYVVPDAPTPKWAAPRCVQRWIAQAIIARQAWQKTQPGAPRYRFGRPSEPCWSQTITLPFVLRDFKKLEEVDLLTLAGIELERLYRVAQTAADEIGETLWTLTLMASCLHLAQIYQELKRRYKARQAREILREALRLFVSWRPDETLAALLIPQPTQARDHAPARKKLSGRAPLDTPAASSYNRPGGRFD